MSDGRGPAAPDEAGPDEIELDQIEPEPTGAAVVFGDRLPAARAYVGLLGTEGVLRGLMGPRETDRLWTRHVLNCAALTELLPPNARVVDVGSGAGLPGIVLAIARPDCEIALLEPLERRVRFLTEAVDQLGLANCRVVRGRAPEAPEVGGADVVVSRAVAPLGKLAGWCAGLTRPGGTVLALKGATAVDELDRDSAEVAAAGLRDARVVRLDGAAGPAYVVSARVVHGGHRPMRARPSGGGGRGPRRAGRRPPASG